VNVDIDILWLLVCIVLVMLMQAGFLCLETGLTRSKNNINVAVKNLTDLGVSMVLFWLVGFGLMFGATNGGWFGVENFAFDLALQDPGQAGFFLFQALFCGAAVTTMSGAVAERLRFGWYVAIVVGITALVYPVLGHWVWHTDGWLAQLGFVDFAGVSIVHSLGGWAGLAVILILGPRAGRFGANAFRLGGANVPFATLGALLLWTGWTGFNGGSLGTFDGRVVGVVGNTAMAGAAGLLTALAGGWLRTGQPRVTDPINGMLAGLVAVTGAAHGVSTVDALIIGAVGALCMRAVEGALERLQIDDAVGAVPVHLGAGLWGTVAVALFGDQSIFTVQRSMMGQVGVQVLGLIVTGVWVFGLVWTVCWLGNRRWPLRVSAEDERIGLNVAEHGASTELMDLFLTMEDHAASGDLTARVPENPFSEVGQIGQQYNKVIAALDQSEADLDSSERTANLDPLTQTLNRRGLSATLEFFRGGPMTVLMFDVVRFGSINGSLGHTAGDEVLAETAHHIGRRLGGDWWFGRWGGDEFVAVTNHGIDIEEDVVSAVVCQLPSGGQIKVGLRAGMVRPVEQASPDEVMRQASYALDESKRTTEPLVEFSGEVERRYWRTFALAASLGGSLSSLRIVPVAQTIFDGPEVVGVEMLARWQNDDGTLSPPIDFLPVLVEHGLMFELDLHMIEQAVVFAARFNDHPSPIWVSVNVSAPNLGVLQLVEHVKRMLTQHSVTPHRLVIEITEAEQVLAASHWVANAHRLRELGVGLAIDDFGSGYSGIERMSVIPVTHVKFDGELTRSVDGPLGGIVKSVVDYTRDAGVMAVAEGVETIGQQQAVNALGIDVMQGFLFSRPEPLDDVACKIFGSQHPETVIGS